MTTKKVWGFIFMIILLAGVGAVLLHPAPLLAQGPSPEKPSPAGPQPVVRYDIKHTKTPPLRELPQPASPAFQQPAREIFSALPLPFTGAKGPQNPEADPARQSFGPVLNTMPTPLLNFEGIGNVDGVLPPDTDGDVGHGHYLQMVNLSLAVWDITTNPPNLLLGPVGINTLWAGFGGTCETNNNGDPIVLYDHLTDRWMVSQFGLNFPNDFHQCIAVSQTGDPTGSWYLYDFLISTTKMNDYPKFGLWPDGWYMSINQFDGSTSGWAGAGAVVFERDKMLNGQAAQMVYFDNPDPTLGGMLPSDLDGDTLPPTGSPNYFVQADDGAPDQLQVWGFHVDWTTPANSTFTQLGTLPTAAFDGSMCGGSRNCIPQPETSQGLDSLAYRLMYRLAYRNFGSYQAMVVNHTVDATGGDQAGVRWYELRNTGGGWSIHQQGTYTGDTANNEHRWMGSAAMDKDGNIALGYSVSGNATYPSIRYTGRLAGDPLNTLPQGETQIIAGSGSQTHSAARWGDYSSMSIAPDGCTFWYTQEYVETTDVAPWQTRIASFSFPTCHIAGRGILQGTVIDAATSNPVSNVIVTANAFSTFTDNNGFYQFSNVPTGTYTVTVTTYGYNNAVATGVTIAENATTTRNFALTSLPMVAVSGTITDAVTGWPLYARLSVSAPGSYSDIFFSDPVTGFYSVMLAQGITHTFSVESIIPGYTSVSRNVSPPPGGSAEDFALPANQSTCNAPGYSAGDLTLLLSEDFTSGIPGTWSIVNNGGNCVWRDDDPAGRGNNTGGSGLFAIADADYCGSDTTMDTELRSPVFDASSYGDLVIEYKNDYSDLGSTADVEVYNGASWTTVESLGGVDSQGPETRRITTTVGASSTNAQVRWHYAAGWDWWWEVDEVRIYGAAACTPAPGGLVVGNAYDNNTGLALNNATVSNDSGETTTSFATPEDPAVDDGFYALFSPAGSHTFTATMTSYAADIRLPTVVQSDTIRQNFHLDAGLLAYTPDSLSVTVSLGMSATLPFNLINSGNADATFEMLELDRGRSILGPIETPQYVVKAFKQNRQTAATLHLAAPPAAPPYAAGNVLQTWSSGLTATWGLAYNGIDDTVWVGEGWGNNTLYQYLPDGTPTGTSWPFNWNPTNNGPADYTFNPNDGTIWAMDVGGDNCIHELDPAAGVTGNTICPTFAASQRGLAYDPTTDVYFAGSWNDSTIYRFSPDGTILQQVNVGLAIAGLAYNPDTAHLFVMPNDSPNDIYVLDADNNFAAVGQFSVTGFSDYGGAGFSMACDGSLWAVDQQAQTVYQIDSGETTSRCAFDVPWLSEDPITGTVTSLGFTPVNATFDAGAPEVDQPGTYYAQLKVQNDTPYQLTNIPVTMTVTTPADWGKLTGTVTGLETCDINPGPLKNATVLLQSGTGMTWSLTTDISGTYHTWLDEANSPLTAVVSAAGYVTQTVTGITVPRQITTTQDFVLRPDAPCLSVTPDSLSVTVSLGMSATLPFNLVNSGNADATFEILELDRGRSILGPIETPQYVVKAFKQNRQTAATLHLAAPAAAPPYAAGNVLQTWSSGLTATWGLAYNGIDDTVWVGEGWGNNTLYQYLPDGTPTGTSWPFNWNPTNGPADYTFNPNDGTIWAMDVGGDNCIHELDPAAGVTGNTICPTFAASQRGLAYDPTTDVYFAGSWNDSTIYRFAPDGTILQQVNVGLAIAGLAYNPDTAHLFVMPNDSPNDIYVLDADNNFAAVGQFSVTGFSDYGGAGFSMACDGSLWAVDQNTETVYQIDSGETTSRCAFDVPWLSEDPVTGTLIADTGQQMVDITFDAGVVTQTGKYYATLWANSGYSAGNTVSVPVTMTVVNYDVAVAPTNAALSADPGAVVTYTLRVTNTGGVADTFNLALIGNIWNTSAPATVGPLAAGAGTAVPVRVVVPADATGGAQDVATIQLTSQGNNHISTQAVLTTRANYVYGASSTFAAAQIGLPGSVVTYTLTLTNTGNTTDTFPVTVGGHTWPTSVPLPTDRVVVGAKIILGPLGIGMSDTLPVIVAIPTGALAGQKDAATLTFTSQGDNAVSSATALTTTAGTVYSLTLKAADTVLSGTPGSAVTYTLTITNLSNITDTYSITAQSAWIASVAAAPGPAAPGSNLVFQLVVNVPANAAQGEINTADIIVTSDGGHIPAALRLTTEAGASQSSLQWVFLPLVMKP